MADNVALTSEDKRSIPGNKYPFWKQKITFFTDNGAHAEQSKVIDTNGWLQSITISLPVTTTTGLTSIITIDDEDGNEIYNSTALDENDVYTPLVSIPLTGPVTVSLDMSADPGANGVSNVVTLRGV